MFVALLLSFGGRVFLHPLRLSLFGSPALRPVLPAILSDVWNTCTTPDGLPTDAPKFLDMDFQTVPKFLDGLEFLQNRVHP